MNEFEIGWDITKEEDYDPRDYSLAGAGDIVIPTLKRPTWNTVWVVDQWIDEYTQWACVPLNCYLSIINTWALSPDWTYFYNMLNDLKTDWLWSPWVWASLPKVMDWMRKRWNKDNHKMQIVYYRDLYNDPIIKETLKKAYRIVLRFGVRTSYQKDRDDNLIINKTSYPESEKYGHIVSLFFSPSIKQKTIKAFHPTKDIKICTLPDKWDWLYIFDTYPFKRPNSNIYQINTLRELIKNWVYSQWAYTILRK